MSIGRKWDSTPLLMQMTRAHRADPQRRSCHYVTLRGTLARRPCPMRCTSVSLSLDTVGMQVHCVAVAEPAQATRWVVVMARDATHGNA
jgi:hypothetical protein